MSTRAIFAKQLEDGKYLGGWQWNDGNIIPSELTKRISTLAEAELLISLGEWRCLMNRNEKNEHIKFCESLNKNNPKHYAEEEKPKFQKIGKYYVLLKNHKSVEFNKPQIYDSIEDMLGQDVNYVYVFDTMVNKWIKHKW